MESCPRKWQAACPRRDTKEGCFRVTHHLWYPSTEYNTPLERQFRELPENKTRMCKHVEEQLHQTQPEGPPKPTTDVMEYCVGQRALRLALEQERPGAQE